MHAEAAIWYASFLYRRKAAPASALWNIHLSQLMGGLRCYHVLETESDGLGRTSCHSSIMD